MASSKVPPKALSLSRFILRRKVLALYKDAMKSLKLVEDPIRRKELRDWIRIEFRNNAGDTDEDSIRMLLTQGKRSLQELQSTLKRVQ